MINFVWNEYFYLCNYWKMVVIWVFVITWKKYTQFSLKNIRRRLWISYRQTWEDPNCPCQPRLLPWLFSAEPPLSVNVWFSSTPSFPLCQWQQPPPPLDLSPQPIMAFASSRTLHPTSSPDHPQLFPFLYLLDPSLAAFAAVLVSQRCGPSYFFVRGNARLPQPSVFFCLAPDAVTATPSLF